MYRCPSRPLFTQVPEVSVDGDSPGTTETRGVRDFPPSSRSEPSLRGGTPVWTETLGQVPVLGLGSDSFPRHPGSSFTVGSHVLRHGPTTKVEKCLVTRVPVLTRNFINWGLRVPWLSVLSGPDHELVQGPRVNLVPVGSSTT